MPRIRQISLWCGLMLGLMSYVLSASGQEEERKKSEVAQPGNSSQQEAQKKPSATLPGNSFQKTSKEQTELAERYFDGDGVPKNEMEGETRLQAVASRGYADAQYILGRRYLLGYGVQIFPHLGVLWLSKAVEQGHPFAIRDLAMAYGTGKGLDPDANKAKAQIDLLFDKSPAIFKSESMPIAGKADYCHHIIAAYYAISKDRKAEFDKLKKILEKEVPKSSLLLTAEGEFYINYAWDARTGKPGSAVTDQQFQLFEQRLKQASKSLEKAWTVDNKNCRAATRRITIATGLGEKRSTMELWFDRAKKADPNSLDPYTAKVMYLEPKWHGDDQGKQLLAFGRECLKTKKWDTSIPLVLISIHETLSKYPQGDRNFFVRTPDPKYFELPEVWADVQAVFKPFLAQNPKANIARSRYARFACWAGHWDIAQQQFEILGNSVVESVFTNKAELVQLKKQAAEKKAANK